MENESGTGKTTIQKVINSIWGNPTDMMLIAGDTLKSQFHQMGVYNNIAVCTDEVTNMENDRVSNISYGVSQGRSNNRMKSNANEMRINNTTWSLPAFFSGNSSMHDKMATLKATPESEQLRIVEIGISADKSMDKETSDEIFEHALPENYGHAGPILIQYMVNNLDAVKKLLTETQKKFDAEAKLQQKQRFYSAGAATAFTAAMIADELGLIKIDIPKVWAWAVTYFSELRESVKPAERDGKGSIGTFLNEFQSRHMLVVDDANDKRTGLSHAPMVTPYGSLIIRYEPDTSLIWIAVDKFREWCTERQIGYKGVVDDLKKYDPECCVKKKGMAKGTALNTPAISALRIDKNKLGIEITIPPVPADGSK